MSGTTSRHGTIARYTTQGCRCVACKAAWAQYQRDKRSREALAAGRRVRPKRPVAEHGTRARYNHHGCRCDPCTWANAEASAAFRARQATS